MTRTFSLMGSVLLALALAGCAETLEHAPPPPAPPPPPPPLHMPAPPPPPLDQVMNPHG
jgi:hypothetical protein